MISIQERFLIKSGLQSRRMVYKIVPPRQFLKKHYQYQKSFDFTYVNCKLILSQPSDNNKLPNFQTVIKRLVILQSSDIYSKVCFRADKFYNTLCYTPLSQCALGKFPSLPFLWIFDAVSRQNCIHGANSRRRSGGFKISGPAEHMGIVGFSPHIILEETLIILQLGDLGRLPPHTVILEYFSRKE